VPAIFINYRNGDEEATATAIDQELRRRFGRDQVFRASRSIPPGEDYVPALLTAVRDSEVLLAVVGSRWLTAVDEQGRNRLETRPTGSVGRFWRRSSTGCGSSPS